MVSYKPKNFMHSFVPTWLFEGRSNISWLCDCMDEILWYDSNDDSGKYSFIPFPFRSVARSSFTSFKKFIPFLSYKKVNLYIILIKKSTIFKNFGLKDDYEKP